METIEYRTIDKTDWPRGEWDAEPDKKQWQDEATGLPCLITRVAFSGHLCGYVGVPEKHPFFGKDGCDFPLDVHGGITFTGGCADHSRETHSLLRERIEKARAEVAKYPSGDAARLIKEQAHLVDDYDAWVLFVSSRFVCHVPGDGEPDKVWWLGFDCAHCDDLSCFATKHDRFSRDGTYQNYRYVERQCKQLAAQLAQVA